MDLVLVRQAHHNAHNGCPEVSGGTMQKSFFEGCTRRILSCGRSLNQVHPPKVKGSSPFQATALFAFSENLFSILNQSLKGHERVKR